MDVIAIGCPKCQTILKLKNRNLLGKVGICPKCNHKFILQQEETELGIESIEKSDQPAEGLHPQWIPDQAPPKVEKQKEQPATQKKVAKKPEENPLAFLNESHQGTASTSDFTSNEPPPVYQKKRKSSNTITISLTLLALVFAVGGAGYLYVIGTKQTKKPDREIAEENANPKETPGTLPGARITRRYNPVLAKSPTSGKPIQLLNMPAGVRIIINLRPGKLWSNEPQYAEFLASMGPLKDWFETEVREISKQQNLAIIDEMLIGIILGPRGTKPEIAAVIHFAEEQNRSDLLTLYDGKAVDEFSTDLKISEGRAYRILNNKTVAICPEAYVEDMVLFEKSPALTGDNLQEILEATDRARLITIAFDPIDIEQHLESLFPGTAEMITKKALRWLGDDAWAAAWSLHVEDDFYAELIVRGRNEVGPTSLSRIYSQRLQTLPEMLLTAVQKMEPQRAGPRKIIGRYPAMMKVVSMTTAVAVDGRFVRMGTLLPLKAGPNLTLGTLLAWDESTRTNFNTQVVVKPAGGNKPDIAKLPMPQRLERKIDVDFRRTPLQEAFAYIAEESKIIIEIDGDALKLAGFTKNMPQTFKMSQAPVRETIYGIIKTYETEDIPLVIHISEKENKIIVLTKPVAESRKLKIYSFKK